jgi:V-type H+-transporting ATPase subunit H
MEKSEVSKALYGQIQWEQLPSSGVFLQHRDHQLLERAQSNLSVILDHPTDARDYVTILLKIAESCSCSSNITMAQYVFTRMEEVLGLGLGAGGAGDEGCGMQHVGLFVEANGQKVGDGPWRGLGLGTITDIYLQKSASVVYGALLSAHEGNAASLVTWITTKLSSQGNGVWEMALPALSRIASTTLCRSLLLSSSIIPLLLTILKRLGVNGNSQSLYDLVHILWCMSLTYPSSDAFTHSACILLISDLLAASPSRKVTRMCIALLRNLTVTELALNEMYTCGLVRTIENLTSNQSMKQMNDAEVEGDFKVLSDMLHRNYRELSTFERWTNEVESGALRWGILHTEKFWKENARFMEKNNFEMLKALIELLGSTDPTAVCVALYDLGEWTRYYPNGKVVVSRLGGKDRVMAMLSTSADNEEVQRHVLGAISKIMVTNWEHLR